MPAGRPRKHDRAKIIRDVCASIATGTLVKDACIPHGISAGHLRLWVSDDPELAVLYARAREDQAHAIAEEAIQLADGAVSGKDGTTDKVRIQVDTRKWLASKIAPRYYSERVTQEITGADGGPVEVAHVFQFGDRTVTY